MPSPASVSPSQSFLACTSQKSGKTAETLRKVPKQVTRKAAFSHCMHIGDYMRRDLRRFRPTLLQVWRAHSISNGATCNRAVLFLVRHCPEHTSICDYLF